MYEFDIYHILIILLMVVGISSIMLHLRSYQNLFRLLKQRGIVGDEFKPDWMSKVGALGCMGYVTRIKREIGVAKLNVVESSLLQKTIILYSLGSLATFVAVCLFFWRLYGVPN